MKKISNENIIDNVVYIISFKIKNLQVISFTLTACVLEYLFHFEIQTLKINQSMTENLTTSSHIE